MNQRESDPDGTCPSSPDLFPLPNLMTWPSILSCQNLESHPRPFLPHATLDSFIINPFPQISTPVAWIQCLAISHWTLVALSWQISLLCLSPMKSNLQLITGVILLLKCKPDQRTPLKTTASVANEKLMMLGTSLAGQWLRLCFQGRRCGFDPWSEN